MHSLIWYKTAAQSLKGTFLPIALVLACFGLSPRAQAVTPAPDGGYPGANTAEGVQALDSRTTGVWNTALGFQALFDDSTGNGNTAIGFSALFNNTMGDSNTAIGSQALINNTTGDANIALGVNAGINLTIGDNNIDIANPGVTGESDTIRIGRQGIQTRTFIAGISGTTVSGSGVFVNGSGQLGVAPSSKRFKEQIKPMDKASEAILALKPVTFRYKEAIDPNGAPQFGLVAEEVEKVSPALVTHDAKGEVFTVRYEAVNAMLLNEFLKEHGKVEKLEATAAQQQQEIRALTASLKEQASQIQKVRARVEMSKSAPQIVLNDQ